MVWETPEVIAAMNDADFASAVQRAVTSHRQIFGHQERNWAAVRLRANLMPARVAAERARQGLGASGRARARAKPALAAPAGAASESLPSRDAPSTVASVTVRRFRKAARAEAGAPAETLQAAPLEALPRAENVPRYTSYQYCVDTNAHLHDEVRWRLLYTDQEGEMRAASDDDDVDVDDEDSSESDEEATAERRSSVATGSRGAKSPARPSQETKMLRMTSAMRAAEKRREAEEAAAEMAALEDWAPRDDYMLFALARTLGETSRVLDAIAQTMRMSATKLRARLRRLEGGAGGSGAERRDDAEKARRPRETLAETYARARIDVVRSGATASAEYRAAAARAVARGGARRVGVGDADAVPVEAPRAFELVPKGDPEDGDADPDDLDDGRDAPGRGTGTDRPSDPAVARKHAFSASSRERAATWSLTAWRFLLRSGDALEPALPPLLEAEAPGARALFDDESVDEGLDSFRSLFCARCHVYDCATHGCGQMARGATRPYEPPAPERGPGGRPKAPKERDEKDAEANGASDSADGATRAPPCPRSCWRLSVDPAALAAANGACFVCDAAAHPQGPFDAAARASDAPFEGVPLFDPRAARREAEAYIAARAAAPAARALWSREKRAWHDGFLVDRSAALNGGVRWSTFETSLFERLREAFARSAGGDARVDPCALARAIDGPTCASVFARLTRDARAARVEAARAEARGAAPETREGDAERFPAPARNGRGKKRRRCAYGSKPSASKKVAPREIPTTRYQPCACRAGPGDARGAACGADCGCAAVGNFCEKWCACGGKCGNAFPGCSCKKGQCNTRACPCFAANRECDPDICKRCAHTAECRAHERRDGWPFSELCMPVPEAPAPPEDGARARVRPTERCGNMRVLLSQRKHVQLGLSNVAGWGAFARDGAARNELLGEYTGELVTQKEADRRGKVYDKHSHLSFLFNLNTFYVLDGHLRGNKLKFANHSSAPNCFARVLMVRGDHRVGIFALRDIEPGEELFFDYCYERDKAPAWVNFDDLPDDAAKKRAPDGNAMKARG